MSDVLIVGAGVMGCAIAYFLSKKGMRVTVVEKDSIGSQASGSATGILLPLIFDVESIKWKLPLSLKSFQLHKALHQELKDLTGLDDEFRLFPQLILTFSEDEARDLKRFVHFFQAKGIRSEWLDRQAVLNVENAISPKVCGALRCENGGTVDSYKLVLALAQAAEKLGAEFRTGEVIGLCKQMSEVTGVRLRSAEIDSDRVILTMGPWTGIASSWLDFPLPVYPEKGQILKIRPLGHRLHHTIFGYGYYATTKTANDNIWAGTTHEDVGFDAKPTAEGRDCIISGLLCLMPDSGDAQLVEHSSCLRPASADGVPLIGKILGWNNVYVASGHWAKGILLAPVTAMLIEELIIKGKTSFEIRHFSPARFVTHKTRSA